MTTLCRHPCGLRDSQTRVGDKRPNKFATDHYCFLPVNHPGPHLYIDRCGKMRGPVYGY